MNPTKSWLIVKYEAGQTKIASKVKFTLKTDEIGVYVNCKMCLFEF